MLSFVGWPATRLPQVFTWIKKIKIKSSLYSQYYAESCDEWRGPSPRLSAWATQKHRIDDELLATVSDLTGLGIELKTTRADSDVFNHWLIYVYNQNISMCMILYFSCIFILLSWEIYHSAIPSSLLVVGHLSTTLRWGNPARCLS